MSALHRGPELASRCPPTRAPSKDLAGIDSFVRPDDLILTGFRGDQTQRMGAFHLNNTTLGVTLTVVTSNGGRTTMRRFLLASL